MKSRDGFDGWANEEGSSRNGVMVVQMGARRDYSLARMLHSKCLLSCLQTSAAWFDGDRPSIFLRAFVAGRPGVERRTVRRFPREKLRTTILPEAAGYIMRKASFRTDVRYSLEDAILGCAARRADFSETGAILNTMGNGGLGFLKWARKKGLLILTDVFITPLADRIEAAEQERWPAWKDNAITPSRVSAQERRLRRLIGLSDVLICPSATVEAGLRELGCPAEKIALVPYPFDARSNRTSQPVQRRVLFAGSDALRKGLPYLALAARQLTPLGYDVRVAGHITKEIRERPECDKLRFLGHLTSSEMENEFLRADTFCLPSLAEGMACVTLEALTHGVPCIVTTGAGAPVSDGYNGTIVPARDAEAIVTAIRAICENRRRRDQMSDCARRTALDHSSEQVSVKLAHLVQSAFTDRRTLRDG